jgi:hypothetical protein
MSQPAADEGLHALPVSPGQNDGPSPSRLARCRHFLLIKWQERFYAQTRFETMETRSTFVVGIMTASPAGG